MCGLSRYRCGLTSDCDCHLFYLDMYGFHLTEPDYDHCTWQGNCKNDMHMYVLDSCCLVCDFVSVLLLTVGLRSL